MSEQQTTLVIQSFGRESEYRRAILTILSYYAHTSLALEETRVILFTDQPDYFTDYFKTLPVDYVLLTPAKIKEMRGDIDFLHRMKIALIEEAFGMMRGPMLYADSDTFFTADPTSLMRQVNADKAFMHLWEYRFESMRHLPLPGGETFRAFLELIEQQDFQLANGDRLKVHPEQVSWNAGVMLFDPSHVRFIPDVYTLTDQFYPPTKNHASEQYAFSVILQNQVELLACDEVIYHYWYRVKKQIVDIYLAGRLTKDWAQLDSKEKLSQVKKWSASLPSYFESNILTIQDQAIQAMNENRFRTGYYYTLKALIKKPIDIRFFKDIMYHTKRSLINKKQ